MKRLPILFALALLSACSPPGPREAESIPSPHRPLAGSLEENLLRIQNDQFVEACDSELAAKKLELARALDARSSEIEKFTSGQAPSNRYRTVPLPPTFVREPVETVHPATGWQEDFYGWSEMHERYQAFKDRPVGPEWLWLNGNVRSLILDDELRVVYGANVYLDKDSGVALGELAAQLEKCLGRSDCAELQLSPHARDLEEINPFYRWFAHRLRGEPDPSLKRDVLQRYARRVRADLRQYAFTPNLSVRRERQAELALPLDAGVFGASEAGLRGLARYIEDEWKGAGLSLRVRWQSAEDRPDIFRILLESVSGGRAYVLPGSREVHLVPYMRARSLAHEIGHVLGFTDHYHTVWIPQNCRYKTQFREDDIMSDSDRGLVTREEWETLERVYPFRAP